MKAQVVIITEYSAAARARHSGRFAFLFRATWNMGYMMFSFRN